MRNYILLAVALVAGMLAFFLTKMQIDAEKQKLGLVSQKIKVLIPRNNMLRGDVVQPSDLGLREIFASSASDDQVRFSKENIELVIGQRLAVDKKPDAIFQWQDFQDLSVGVTGSSLARTIQKMQRGLSLSVDLTSSVSGMIRPNDHVDIIGTFRFPADEKGAALDTVTLTILQNVTVLAVGQQMASVAATAAGGERSRSYSTVTLAVTPKEAEMLVFAQQKGSITFTLRNPGDPYIEKNVQNVNFNYLKTNAGEYTKDREARLKLAPVHP